MRFIIRNIKDGYQARYTFGDYDSGVCIEKIAPPIHNYIFKSFTELPLE